MSQKENWLNIFVKLELGLEFLVQEEQREEEILTQNNFVEEKREKELDSE